MVNRITNWISVKQSEPTMVGQDKLQVPTLSINKFVNRKKLKDLKIHRVF